MRGGGDTLSLQSTFICREQSGWNAQIQLNCERPRPHHFGRVDGAARINNSSIVITRAEEGLEPCFGCPLAAQPFAPKSAMEVLSPDPIRLPQEI